MSKLRPSSPAVWRVALGLLAVCLLLCACSQQRKSQGAPYKVLIYGHDNESAKAVEAKLTLTFISHLPQRERLLTVERTANEKKAHLARCLVSIDTDCRKHHDTRLHLTTNRWARPQLALHITTPSASHLRHFLATRGDLICQQIEAFEKRQTVADLRHSHERNVEQLMRKQTGHTLWVPKSLNAVKEGKDFIWVAAGESHDALNICLYSYPATGLDAEQLIRMRDSIMKVNIPGELPGTYMQTEREWEPVARPLGDAEKPEMELYALWNMNGDAMGGPFVCRARLDPDKQRVIVAEGFIFAPGKRKRPHLKMAEAIISTLN